MLGPDVSTREVASLEDSWLLPLSQLPEYESEIDHAGILGTWGERSLERGKQVYQRVCQTCHGDSEAMGSLPQALRFSEGEFQNGSDPYSMYTVITRGWRMMPPQSQLSPREKYDIIHYIREAFMKSNEGLGPIELSESYLSGLPQGHSLGPAAKENEPWKRLDYGSFLINTYELADSVAGKDQKTEGYPNITYKGIAVRLDSGTGGVAASRAFSVFDQDTLRLAGAWVGPGFIDWRGIQFDGQHHLHARIVGDQLYDLPDGPGWAHPKTQSFEDQRFRGLDGRRYGPLPRDWARYQGLYQHGDRVVVRYRVGDARVLESSRLLWEANRPTLVRIFNLGRSSHDLVLKVARAGASVSVTPNAGRLRELDGFWILEVPAESTPLDFELYVGPAANVALSARGEPEDLAPLTKGGPSRWPERLSAPIKMGAEGEPFAVDEFVRPLPNPWGSELRMTGLDFLDDGNAAVVCTWDGEVWRVDGIQGSGTEAVWRRIGSGLFQPLGIKVVEGVVYLTCRDQIVALRDLNGDGETDYYECVNGDHQVTEHFHEFAMGLQVDEQGNFYYAKSARHGKPGLVPHHGTVIRVSADGERSDIVAHGLRAANGVCLNEDGTLVVTDQEGHWMPMNRINWVETDNRFYGNLYGYGAPTDPSDEAMEGPLLWIDKEFDRSPAEPLWIDSESWGALDGELLSLSYGRGEINLVLREDAVGVRQGAIVRLPVPAMPTGIVRGRFHSDGSLYVCGLSAWATNQTGQKGGLFRVRPTGQALNVPIQFRSRPGGLELRFSDAIDPASWGVEGSFKVTVWDLLRSEEYGSERFGERSLVVENVLSDEEGRLLSLSVPELGQVDQVEVRFDLLSANGDPVRGVLLGTIKK